MRQAKRLTRAQKELVSGLGLNCDNWLCVEDSPKRLIIRHKVSDKERTFEKVK